MWQQAVDFLVSGFIFSLPWNQILIGIGLGLAFGAVWLSLYWPPMMKKPQAWLVLAGSAFLTWLAVAFIQLPLQHWTGQALTHFWDMEVLMRWFLLASIPGLLLSGLVQEGAKMVHMVLYWLSHGKDISPKAGLAIGAIAGAGFGIFEAVWVHNLVLAGGWSWAAVQGAGITALAPFWERFFIVAFHTSVSALVGYGLASDRGWQFYLLGSLLHALVNYGAVLYQSGKLTVIQVEIIIAVIASLVAIWALWLRWRKSDESGELEATGAEI